jgi:Co/Zn/Cd efflux system component
MDLRSLKAQRDLRIQMVPVFMALRVLSIYGGGLIGYAVNQVLVQGAPFSDYRQMLGVATIGLAYVFFVERILHKRGIHR